MHLQIKSKFNIKKIFELYDKEFKKSMKILIIDTDIGNINSLKICLRE